MVELIQLKTPAPATGIGDRLGVWLNVFALAELRNSSVLLDWPNAWEAMTLALHAPVMHALGCLDMPPYVRQHARPHGDKAPLVLDLTVPSVLRGFNPSAPKQKAAHFRHRVAFDKLPHLMWGLWQRRGLLDAGLTCGRYLSTYQAAASAVRLTPACALPMRLMRPPLPHKPRIHVHLRRADRGSAGRGASTFRKNSLKALRMVAAAMCATRSNPQQLSVSHSCVDVVTGTPRAPTPSSRWLPTTSRRSARWP